MSNEGNEGSIPNIDMGVDPFDDVIEFESVEENNNEEDNEPSEGESDQPSEPIVEDDSGDDNESTGESPEENKEEADPDGEKVAEQSPEKEVGDNKEEKDKEKEEPPVEMDIVKIDGKEVEYSKDDIYKAGKEHIAGKVVWDKKFNDLNVDKKKYEAELQEVNGYINEFGSKMKEGDILGAFEYFGSFANVPSYQVKEKLLHALIPEIQRRSTMNESEVQVELQQAQIEHLNNMKESDDNKIKQEQANKALLDEMTGIREAHNIDEEKWNTTYDYIKNNLGEGTELTPELVKDTILNERRYIQAETLLGSFNQELAKDEVWNETLVNIMEKNPDFNDEDLNLIVKTWVEKMDVNKTESKLKEKILKHEGKKESKKTTIVKTDDNGDEKTAEELELEELFC